MANGFCPYLLEHLSAVAGCNTPSMKITPAGFLRSLLVNRPNVSITNAGGLKLDEGNGHIRDVRLKYRKRGVPGQVSHDDNCDIQVAPQYEEMELPLTEFSKLGVYIPDEDMARYCSEASALRRPGGWPTPFMSDFLEAIMEQANALLGDIDSILLTKMLTKFGVNVVTGTNTATTVNINQDANIRDLEDGVVRILSDAMENEMCGDLVIWGSGLFNNYNIQNIAACCAANGIDTSQFTGYQWFFDLYAKAIMGTNHIGVYDRGSLGFIEVDRYKGFRAGRRGADEFFNAPLPINCPECNGGPMDINFDFQLQYVTCPTTMNVGCEGERVVDRGHILHISKAYDLFSLPTDAYQHTAYGDCYNDRLAGNNGTLRYVITNT